MGAPAYIIFNAPFLSKEVYDKQTKTTYYPFLGDGYYLWEENIDMAHRWGKRQYYGIYSIIEYEDLSIAEEDFLDMTNRRSLSWFNELIELYKNDIQNWKTWKLHQWISLFKKLKEEENNDNFFPVNFIKSTEFQKEWEVGNLNQKILLNKNYFTYRNPINVICCIDKTKMIYKSERIVK